MRPEEERVHAQLKLEASAQLIADETTPIQVFDIAKLLDMDVTMYETNQDFIDAAIVRHADPIRKASS